MRKINKNLENIPSSLVVKDENVTHQRRLELIGNKGYIDEKRYNSRYKTQDIRDELVKIYHNKCAFCEQKVEQSHIEHFRPKKIYYWLAYSWDNLILSCPECNIYKRTHFDIKGKQAKCPSIKNLNDINTISTEKYNLQEKPKFINPEVSDPRPYLIFETDGNINSDNEDYKYTIQKCRINRIYLKDERRKILDEFKDSIRSELYRAHTIDDQKKSIEVGIRCFKNKAMDEDSEYFAFRNYAITHNWLHDIIKNIIKELT